MLKEKLSKADHKGNFHPFRKHHHNHTYKIRIFVLIDFLEKLRSIALSPIELIANILIQIYQLIRAEIALWWGEKKDCRNYRAQTAFPAVFIVHRLFLFSSNLLCERAKKNE